MGSLARHLPRAPVVAADLPLMRNVGTTMFVGGALSSLAGVATVQTTHAGRVSQALLASALLLCGVLLRVAPARPLTFRIAAGTGTTIVSGMIATAQPISATAYFYLWPVLFTAYFLGRRTLLATMLWIAATMAPALALSADHLDKADLYTSTLTSVGLVGAMVVVMRERERRLAGSLELAARTDALTGLLNRHGLAPELERLVALARRTHEPLTIVLFDLDHFKRFNDAHGHLAGDHALRRAARILEGCARADDRVARFGGEEFAVVLPGASAPVARAFAGRVATALAHEEVDEPLRLTASCGLAELAPGDDGLDPVLGRADEALYAAKAAGRSRTAVWSGDRAHVFAPLSAADHDAHRAAHGMPHEYAPRPAA